MAVREPSANRSEIILLTFKTSEQIWEVHWKGQRCCAPRRSTLLDAHWRRVHEWVCP